MSGSAQRRERDVSPPRAQNVPLEECSYLCYMVSKLQSSGPHQCQCGAHERNTRRLIAALREAL